MPIVADLAAARETTGGGVDGIILTDTLAPQAAFDELLAICAGGDFAAGRVVAPSLLGIMTTATPLENMR